MERNLTETEQRMISLLRNDSRRNISEIASSLGISRVTAKKTLDALIEDGVIRSFTIKLETDDTNLVLVLMEDLEGVSDELLLEDYELIDGKHLLVLYYEDLPRLRSSKILNVRIVTRKVRGNALSRMEHIHCDLCGKEIPSKPIIVEVNRKVYYACCPTCERGLKRRRMENVA